MATGTDQKAQAATLIEQSIYDALIALAKANERSVAAELRLAIQNHLAKGSTT
jgi:hypothetical protein